MFNAILGIIIIGCAMWVGPDALAAGQYTIAAFCGVCAWATAYMLAWEVCG